MYILFSFVFTYGLEGLCVLRMWRVPSREPRQRSWPVRSQQTEKILPRVLEASMEALSATSCSSSSFALLSLDSTQRFCSLLNVQMRTTHYSQHIPQFRDISKAILIPIFQFSNFLFTTNTISSHFPSLRFLWLDPTANASPSGDHFPHSAALLIFSTTRVGTQAPFSNVQT